MLPPQVLHCKILKYDISTTNGKRMRDATGPPIIRDFGGNSGTTLLMVETASKDRAKMVDSIIALCLMYQTNNFDSLYLD